MNPTLQAWKDAAPGFLARQEKHVRQARYGWMHPRQVSFVFGCQRSGTKMLMRILDNSPETRIYHENHVVAFEDFRLRSDATVRTLCRLHPAPAQIFKPICDSHVADQILARFPDARGLWTYRHPDDVANSAVEKWGAHQAEIIDAIVAGDLSTWGWRTERLSEDLVQTLRDVHGGELSPEEGALLFWYLRNRFFLSLGLDRHPRVRLVKYEDLVTAPAEAFPAVFQHLGVPWDPAYIARVRASSVRRKPAPAARPAIRALCEELLAALDAARLAPPARPLPSPVLLITNSMGVGGAERYVVTVSNWLAAQGVEVAVAAQEGELARTLAPAVRYHPTPLVNLRLGIPRAVLQVRGLLRTQRPRVVVANSLVATWLARLADPAGRVPVINVAHGWPADRYRAVGRLMRVADRVVAVSEEVKAHLVGGGLDPVRCTVVVNGVDCAPLGPRTGAPRARARAEMGAGPGELLVVLLGRLTTQKAHQHVITLARDLAGDLPELRFCVVGGGERQAELEALAAEAGVAPRVRFLGVRADVPDLLGSADLYLSTSDWEGMPLSTIEAMASGLACVATATEGSSLLLTDDCGLRVPVGDVAAMAEALRTLARDPARRARMGEAARARALARFSHDRMARELAQVMQELA